MRRLRHHQRLLLRLLSGRSQVGWESEVAIDQGLHKLLGTIRDPKAAQPCPQDRR